jgi:hypothetical protein
VVLQFLQMVLAYALLSRLYVEVVKASSETMSKFLLLSQIHILHLLNFKFLDLLQKSI